MLGENQSKFLIPIVSVVQDIRLKYEAAESKERQHFIEYSSAVRLSHEKERTRVERTKYWSIIASISGTVLGMFILLCLP